MLSTVARRSMAILRVLLLVLRFGRLRAATDIMLDRCNPKASLARRSCHKKEIAISAAGKGPPPKSLWPGVRIVFRPCQSSCHIRFGLGARRGMRGEPRGKPLRTSLLPTARVRPLSTRGYCSVRYLSRCVHVILPRRFTQSTRESHSFPKPTPSA